MMSNQETKSGGHINVTVRGLQDGDEVFFRIKRSSSGQSAKKRGEQIPIELEMEEGDEISANRVGAQLAKKRGKISNAETEPRSGCGCITLTVQSQNGNTQFFRIKRSGPLKKLMDLYCERQSLKSDDDAVSFLFNGRRLLGEQTPDQLAMKEGDKIDALLNQRGC